MQQFQVDVNEYIYYDQEVQYRYQHKYLVPGSEDESNEDKKEWLGPEEKWGSWTELDARKYSSLHGVDIVQTRKKPIKRRKK